MIFIILGNGILGSALKDSIENDYASTVIHLSRSDIDLQDSLFNIDKVVNKRLGKVTDNNIYFINAAAHTSVSGAEKEKDKTYDVNANGAHKLAIICRKLSIPIVHFSTDFVFDGTRPVDSPYSEYDETRPVNWYGYTKLMSEKLVRDSGCEHLIIRSGWLYNHKRGIVPSIVKNVLNEKTIHGVVDQIFAPTYAAELAAQVKLLCTGSLRGTFHVTPGGKTTPKDIVTFVSKTLGIDKKIWETSIYRYIQDNATRPTMCLLSSSKLKSLGLYSMRNWKDTLECLLTAPYDAFGHSMVKELDEKTN